MSELQECPYCGNEYKRLSMHLLHCPSKPDEEELEETVSDDNIEHFDLPDVEELAYTSTNYDPVIPDPEVIPEPPVIQDKPCPYLYIIAGNACANCRGLSCMASSDKKISNKDYCLYEWPDCLEYEEARDAGIRPICPYFGLPPPEKPNCCSGIYCYAIEGAIRVPKKCRVWGDCGRFTTAKSNGVPFHRAKVT